MDKIREVTVFTNGDSNNISTWSNVPFFFTETLISRGIKVNRVDLSPSPVLNKLYSKTWERIIRIIYKNTTYTYFRSLVHFLHARLRIKNAVRAHTNSQLNIFLTFSFSSTGLTKTPAIQFCDWTYEHYINYRKNRKPDIFERRCIKREDSQIEGSNLILPLFPGVAEYMKERYKNKNIVHLGNVINSLHQVTNSQILEKKPKSNSLLFIGNEKYAEGAKCLIQAFHRLKKDYPDLSLDIIGLNESDFGSDFGDQLNDGVNCHGYLDKGKENERKLYYSLASGCESFCQHHAKMGGIFCNS